MFAGTRPNPSPSRRRQISQDWNGRIFQPSFAKRPASLSNTGRTCDESSVPLCVCVSRTIRSPRLRTNPSRTSRRLSERSAGSWEWLPEITETQRSHPEILLRQIRRQCAISEPLEIAHCPRISLKLCNLLSGGGGLFPPRFLLNPLFAGWVRIV